MSFSAPTRRIGGDASLLRRSQELMRKRVLFQAIAILIAVLLLLVAAPR